MNIDSEKDLIRTDERETIVSTLCCILEQICELNHHSLEITIFHGESIPQISISSYLRRLAKYTECSIEALIQSIIHLVTTISWHKPTFVINSFNLHRLLLTSILCTTKFFDDTFFDNNKFAKFGGITLRELNYLEVEFLVLINFDLFVTFETYQNIYNELSNNRLHLKCNCLYQSIPKLYPQEIIKEIEPDWNIELMKTQNLDLPKKIDNNIELMKNENNKINTEIKTESMTEIKTGSAIGIKCKILYVEPSSKHHQFICRSLETKKKYSYLV